MKIEKCIKQFLQVVVMFFAAAAVLAMVSFLKMDVMAAPAYEEINVESQMMQGAEESYTSIRWTADGKRNSESVNEYTKAESSNPSVLKVYAEEVTGKYSYGASYSFWRLRLEAVRPGTAEVTVQFKKNTVSFAVEVIGRSQAVIEKFPGNMTINKGSSFWFERDYKILCGSYYDYIWLRECEVTSSNPNVVRVVAGKPSETLRQIYIQGMDSGTATITFTVTKEGLLNGLSGSFQVTVKEGPKASAPVIASQTSFQPMVFSDRMFVGIKLLGGNMEYEVYRSTSQNKGYKKIGSFIKENGEAGRLYEYDDLSKNLKANKKYYYKVRARHRDFYYSEEWSEFSAVKEYWTAPKMIEDKKVKYNKKTKTVTIPKVKNISGYIYTPHGVRKLGYNIFGQPVYWGCERTATSTKRIFKVKAFARTPVVYVADVRPYAKHNKYYYAEGYKLTKKLSSFKKAEDGHKFV